MLRLIAIPGDENDTPLTVEEAEEWADFFYAIHNHQATHPQQPTFWWRTYGFKTARC